MRRALIASIFTIALLSTIGVRAVQAAVTPATDAFAAWLKLVDAGDYTASRQASSSFKDHVSETARAEQVGAARKALGAVVSRRV